MTMPFDVGQGPVQFNRWEAIPDVPAPRLNGVPFFGNQNVVVSPLMAAISVGAVGMGVVSVIYPKGGRSNRKRNAMFTVATVAASYLAMAA